MFFSFDIARISFFNSSLQFVMGGSIASLPVGISQNCIFVLTCFIYIVDNIYWNDLFND